MSTLFRRALLGACVVLSIGCASAPERPDWVVGTGTEYPDARFLLGRGQGSSPALARDRARSDLAKNFRVAVSEESLDLLSYTTRSAGNATDTGLEARVSRNIITRTDQVIEGVKIVEQWQDPETGEHHALAVLDRLQAGNQLRRVIGDLDRKTELALDMARSSATVVEQIAMATKALTAQVERRHYQDYLAVVDRTGVGVPPAHDPARLHADLAKLLGRVSIRPSVGGDDLGGLEAALLGAIAASGFVPATGDVATYVLDATSETEELDGGDGWHWVRGRVEVVLLTADRGRVLGSHRWPIKVSARQPAMAKQRAVQQVAEELARDLRAVVVGFGAAAE